MVRGVGLALALALASSNANTNNFLLGSQDKRTALCID
jgi:hypothetical protein